MADRIDISNTDFTTLGKKEEKVVEGANDRNK